MLSFISVSVSRPRLVLIIIAYFRKNHRFHHLSHHTVRQNHYGNPIFISSFKRFHTHIGHFLNGIRSKNNHSEISVTCRFYSLPVIGLRRLYAS